MLFVKKSIKILSASFVFAVILVFSCVWALAVDIPERPAIVNVKSDFTSITLSWDAVENASGYRVYQSVNSKWKALKTTKATKYIVTGLDVDSTYRFAVKPYAKNDGVTYWAKSYTSVYGRTLNGPASPSKINVSLEPSSITLSWGAVKNATGYRIYQFVGGKWKALKTTTSKKYTVTDLAVESEYKFAVKAYTKIDGVTYWASKYTQVTAKTLGLPKKPTKVTIKSYGSVVLLSWNKCHNANGYKIYQSVDGKWKLIGDVTETRYIVKDLYADATYKFAIQPYLAVNGITYTASSYATVSVKTEKIDTGAVWEWPLGNINCYITSSYGSIESSISGSSFHGGVDISGNDIYGKPIYATRDGIVISAVNGYSGYGKYVIIDHGDGFQSLYGHCSSLTVSKGQYVQQGEMIGRVGSSGNSTGPHLHFEIRCKGEKVDPIDFVKKP